MEISKELCSNAVRKIGKLITRASEDGMDVGGYGLANENKTSGNVYIWLEDERSTLYIGLGDDKIRYLRSCFECGHEMDVPRKKRNDDMVCPKCGKDM